MTEKKVPEPVLSRVSLEFIALGIVLLFSVALTYAAFFDDASYLLPSFDNALLHSGRVRYVDGTGFWIPYELVFGGVTPSYHVPAYASLVSGLADLTGLNWLWAIRLFALLMAVLLPLGFYLLGKTLSNWQAGVSAAFLVLLSNGVMTWGTRPSAISLGVVLVVFLLYFLLQRMWAAVVLGAFVLGLTHPPSLLVFFGTSGLYWTLSILRRGVVFSRLADYFFELPLVGALVGFFTYLAWHVSLTGASCLAFQCLPQLGAREFGASVDLLAKAASLPYAMGYFGVLWIGFSRADADRKWLVVAWLLATLLLVKNDALGLGVFTERFVTFFEMALALSGGLLVGLLFEKVAD
ncbi:hypothetical protein HY572_06365 [Candidatus Micrarchaeota archaeon]|nr:hypothetical protein [Candidatus Micrarchaeota archaeon]